MSVDREMENLRMAQFLREFSRTQTECWRRLVPIKKSRSFLIAAAISASVNVVAAA
jgi:hypothetical protein